MKRMIAYNSRILPFLFLIFTILVCICAIFAVTELEKYKILASIFFGIVALVLFLSFIYTLTSYKIAFEIKDETLIIYKRKKVYKIKLSTIQKVKIGKNNIGFDCVIYYNNQNKIGMHFLVKKFVEVNREFIYIINMYNIEKEFYSVG